MPAERVRTRNRRRRALWLALALIASAPLLCWLWFHTESGNARIVAWGRSYGFRGLGNDDGLLPALLGAPSRLLAAGQPPLLRIELRPRHLQQLAAMRERALQKGLIEADEEQEVPAELHFRGTRYGASIRLKGDFADHLAGDKWSLRVELDSGYLAGMRRFSLQDPRTRGYQGELLFLATLRWLGLLAPRHEFVTVDFCGRRLGVMALEEHVARELFESQNRRDSAAVHFDEVMQFYGLDDYRETTVIPFGTAAEAAIPLRAGQNATAVALLRSWVDGVQPVHEVFQVEPLAGYLAAVQFWGAWHAQRWHNMRFYMDPVLQRLEPIGNDANLQMRRPLPSVVALEEDLVMRLLDDPLVLTACVRRLRELCAAVLDGPLRERLAAVEAQALGSLQGDYWLLDPLPEAELSERARFFAELPPERLHMGSGGYLGPATLCVYTQVRDGLAAIELRNGGGGPIAVTGLRWVGRQGPGRSRPCQLPESELPLMVPPRGAGGRGTLRIDGVPAPDPGWFVLEVATLRNGQGAVVRGVHDPAPEGFGFLPTATVAQQLAAHAFLRLADDGRTLLASPGEHRVDQHLIVPPGLALELAAGTTLRFADGTALVAHGPVQIEGTESQPVRLLPQTTRWLGVTVLQPGAPSRWRYAEVRGTSGVAIGTWQLTGAVTFVRAPCHLERCVFADNIAEDALNVISAPMEMVESYFTDSRSDAFDGDFVTGIVSNCRFDHIGGDAVDVSGADVEVVGLEASDVRDKALSVGEASRVRARGLVARQVGTGAASKDGSELQLNGARIESAGVAALLAYTKKAEFGPAVLHAKDVQAAAGVPRARAQLGSTLTLDGVVVPSEPIDVDLLYATAMKK